MATFRCVVQYSLCALSSYGFATAAVSQTIDLANNGGNANAAVRPDVSSADEQAEPDGYPLSSGWVIAAIRQIQPAVTNSVHPMTIAPCSGSTHCGIITVTGSTGGGGSSSIGGSGVGSGPPGGGITISPTGSFPPPSPVGKSGQSCFAPLVAEPRANQAQVDGNELGPIGDRSGPGGMALNGYVPRVNSGAPDPNSGVTIGFGVDLGQLNASQLQAYGVDQRIINELEPWIGKKGQTAQNLLNTNMLTLSSTDATTLSNDVFNGVYNSLKTNFDNNNSMTFYSFEQLPQGAQTALMDMEYNNGDIWDAHSTLVQDAANDASDGDWAGVVTELNTLAGGNPNSRFAKDATDVQNAINQHMLPSKANLDNGKGGECPKS